MTPNPAQQRDVYWRRNLTLTGRLLLVWFVATFVMIYFARELGEVILNALKHAFPEGVAGTIIVRLQRDSDGLVVLTIIDNGQGRDDSETAAAAGLGTKIANLLASQFGGAITYKPTAEGVMASGTTVVVELPKLKMQPADATSEQATDPAGYNDAGPQALRAG